MLEFETSNKNMYSMKGSGVLRLGKQFCRSAVRADKFSSNLDSLEYVLCPTKVVV